MVMVLEFKIKKFLLNVPDVAKIVGIYESINGNSPILDKLTFVGGLN